MKFPKQIPHKRKKEVFERDGGNCQYCGKNGSEIHHIISAGMGRRRDHSIENLLTLCYLCHSLAHLDKDMRAWCKAWSRRQYGGTVDEIEKHKRGGA